MSLVEEAYFRAWGKVGGVGRLRRTFSLFGNMRDMFELQIKREKPGLSDREVRRHTAKRMYISDNAAQGLLDRMGGRDVTAEDDFPETVGRILAILTELGLKFHVTGGVVSSYYGGPLPGSTYPGGQGIVNGSPETGYDFAFSEGILASSVPEPPTFFLGVMGAAGVVGGMLRRKHTAA